MVALGARPDGRRHLRGDDARPRPRARLVTARRNSRAVRTRGSALAVVRTTPTIPRSPPAGRWRAGRPRVAAEYSGARHDRGGDKGTSDRPCRSRSVSASPAAAIRTVARACSVGSVSPTWRPTAASADLDGTAPRHATATSRTTRCALRFLSVVLRELRPEVVPLPGSRPRSSSATATSTTATTGSPDGRRLDAIARRRAGSPATTSPDQIAEGLRCTRCGRCTCRGTLEPNCWVDISEQLEQKIDALVLPSRASSQETGEPFRQFLRQRAEQRRPSESAIAVGRPPHATKRSSAA